MDDPPAILIQHQTAHRSDPDELRAAIAERLPDAPVTLAGSREEMLELVPDAEVVVGILLPEALLDRADSLRWFQAISAGVNHLDLDRLAEMDVVVTNASGVHAEPAAQQVLGYVLAFERNFLQAFEQQRRREFRHYPGGEVTGKTMGVIGLGAIGTRIAELAGAFGMETIGTRRDTSDAPDAVDEVFGPDRTHRVVSRADYLAVACLLTDETRGLIGAADFRAMHPDAVLINVARGPVVDEEALVEALQRGEIRGAALDVFEEEPLPRESPLWDLSKVLITPYNAGGTSHYWERVADIVAENYPHLVDGTLEEMRNRVV